MARYISLNKCEDFLRRHAEALGYKSNFTILDTDDQKKLVRKILDSENIDQKKISPQFILGYIDRWKNKGLLPQDVKVKNSNVLEKTIHKVYGTYQNKIKDLNAFDFGDLILFCVKLFEKDSQLNVYIIVISNIYLSMSIKIQIIFKING